MLESHQTLYGVPYPCLSYPGVMESRNHSASTQIPKNSSFLIESLLKESPRRKSPGFVINQPINLAFNLSTSNQSQISAINSPYVSPIVLDHHHLPRSQMVTLNPCDYCSDTIKTTTTTSKINTNSNTGPVKKKRSWTRAVFSSFQRNNLEIRFAMQKYIAKPDRKKLAEDLNLKDEQVKVWFQNRRMKWRHSKEHEERKKQLNLTEAMSNTTSNPDSYGDDSNSLEIDLRCSSKENKL